MSELTVLLVEDEAPMRRFLRVALEGQGYRLLEAETAREGLSLAASHQPDLALMDLGLPDMDGLELTKRLREWSRVPIIVLSARGQERDKIEALDAGADDYLTKPFSTGELLARMRVALRHRPQGAEADPVFRTDEWEVDFARREVTARGLRVHLTPNEFKLLAVLAQHAGKVLTHRQLLREVWGPTQAAQPHYLRVYMAQLRHKLEADPARPKHLITESGVGYRLRE
ncbi:MAG TPA: response regulator [Holophagaceae bacterium]|jgi:two-component system KDP operon response regulator KdpE|nr:response regulator [Holophagaceae bacterium]